MSLWDLALTALAGYAVYKMVELAIDTVSNWFEARRGRIEIGGLVRQQLATGNVRVVAMGLTRGMDLVDANEWTTDRLSPDLVRAFGSRDELLFEI